MNIASKQSNVLYMIHVSLRPVLEQELFFLFFLTDPKLLLHKRGQEGFKIVDLYFYLKCHADSIKL